MGCRRGGRELAGIAHEGSAEDARSRPPSFEAAPAVVPSPAPAAPAAARLVSTVHARNTRLKRVGS